MPNLIERIRDATNQIKSQADIKVTDDEAKGFRTRDKEFSEPANAISVPTRRLELFKSKGIKIRTSFNEAGGLKKIIDKLKTDYDTDPSSIIEADPIWRHVTRKQLSDLAERAGAEAKQSWEMHLSELRPPIDPLTVRLVQSSPTHASQASQFQQLNAEFNELSGRLPTTEEEISKPEELAAEMRTISENLPDLTESIKELIRSINSGTATTAQLTDETITWLRENDLLESLRLSWIPV